jgi:hypothetical protein
MRMPADKVNAMPAAQVLMLHLFAMLEEFRDDTFKGTYLPLPQAIPVLKASEKRLVAAPETEATLLPRTLLPAVTKVMFATNRLERRIVALRIIEALRLYAAAHDGRLPDKLADIKEVPIPNDPETGKPFEYQLDKESATLTSPPLMLPGSDKTAAPELGLRFRLTIKSKG